MEPWMVVVLVIFGLSWWSRKKEPPSYSSPLDDPNYRWKGERGSSGVTEYTHSSNCECNMCLYHHEPKNPGCRCKACRDPESVYGR
jgi:hypothetical protein